GVGNPGAPTTLTLRNLPAHDSIDIGFLLALIDEWDGNSGFLAPDFFAVLVDDELVMASTFDSEETFNQDYIPPQGAELVVNQDLWRSNGNFESAYDMSADPQLQQIPHSSPNLTIQWLAAGDGYRRPFFGNRDGESFAIDNVSVTLNRGSVSPHRTVDLLETGATWRYLDDGSNQGAGWRQANYDDCAWDQGPAQLGYG
ncbi:MAG: hypothetical protein GY720_19660, partial [bacterium]|nr:hypothetical protein [bacterium]